MLCATATADSKNLQNSIQTNTQKTNIGLQHVHDPVDSAIQCHAPEEEDDQHEVREEGGEVHDLARRLDALDDADVHENPGQREHSQHLPVDVA